MEVTIPNQWSGGVVINFFRYQCTIYVTHHKAIVSFYQIRVYSFI